MIINENSDQITIQTTGNNKVIFKPLKPSGTKIRF